MARLMKAVSTILAYHLKFLIISEARESLLYLYGGEIDEGGLLYK